MQVLRPYQGLAFEKVYNAILRGRKRIIICLPTGGGKTTVASHIIHGANEKGNNSMALAHRTELIKQFSDRLYEHNVNHGIIQGTNTRDEHEPNQVASVQTLIRRLHKLTDKKIVIVDECHRTLGASYKKILEHYSDSIVIGLSATPFRNDGGNLGEYYEEIIECTTVKELTMLGFLVPSIGFTTPKTANLNTKTLRKKGGEYTETSLDTLFNKPTLIADVVQTWEKRGKGRTTVVFAGSVNHSKRLTAEFCKKGYNFKHLDGTTPKDERADILIDLYEGKIDGVVNVGVLTEGWDCPRVSCIVLATITNSLSKYRQMVGRGLRIFKNKVDCMILDHGGNWKAHGAPDEDLILSLTEKVKRKKVERDLQLKNCTECWCIYSGKRCTQCGHEPAVRERQFNEVDGELVQVGNSIPAKDKQRARDVYKYLIAEAKNRRKNDSWVNREFHKIFGCYPKFKGLSLKVNKFKRKKVSWDKGKGTTYSMPYFEYEKSMNRY